MVLAARLRVIYIFIVFHIAWPVEVVNLFGAEFVLKKARISTYGLKWNDGY